MTAMARGRELGVHRRATGSAALLSLNAKDRWSATGRLHSVTNGRFRKAKLQEPLFGNELKKWSVMSRLVADFQVRRKRSFAAQPKAAIQRPASEVRRSGGVPCKRLLGGGDHGH